MFPIHENNLILIQLAIVGSSSDWARACAREGSIAFRVNDHQRFADGTSIDEDAQICRCRAPSAKVRARTRFMGTRIDLSTTNV